MKPSTFQGISLVLQKEIRTGLRFRAAWATMLMFAFTTLVCVSFALAGGTQEPKLFAALLWVLFFFTSMAGADRVFADEETAGTLTALRMYAPSQAVLFGKLLYELLVLGVIAVFLLPLFIVFLGAEPADVLLLLGTVLAGLLGIASAGTLISALTVGAGVRSGLFSVLMLPVILPVFLPAIRLTEAAFGGAAAPLSFLGGMVIYDMILSVGASVLFDYLWYED